MSFSHIAPRPVVLFDLDGTLLPMNMKEFERAYFRTLSAAVRDLPPEELVRCVWAGTRAMAKNNGARTNREAFAAVFSRESGLDFFANEERFLEYYRTGFQSCRGVCPITPVSREIVETLRRKGCTMAVATNPIFPRCATESRLRWLGLSPEDFALVTTYDDFSFAKPSLDYYREVCRRLDVRPEDCVMVGNDVEEDGCARALGMEVLLVSDCLLNARNLPTDGFALGTLADVHAWAAALPARV